MSKKDIPNLLTILRIVFIPVFMLVLIFPLPSDTATRIVAAVLFGLIAVTDLFDGKLARKYDAVSDFGKFLDPIADKLMIIGAMTALISFCGTANGRFNLFGVLSAFGIYLILLREFAVTSLRMLAKKSNGKVEGAKLPGKIKTVTQIVFILAALLESLIWQIPLLTYLSYALMLIMTFYSGYTYFAAYAKRNEK